MISLTDCVFEELCLLLAILLLSFYVYCVRTGTSVDTFVNLEALFRAGRVRREVEKKVPPTPPNTPSKNYSESPEMNSSLLIAKPASPYPEIPPPPADEEMSARVIAAAQQKQTCSGCPDVRPCPRRSSEPSSERSSLVSATNLEEGSDTPKQKSALADKASKSKLPLSVSIQITPPSQVGTSLANVFPRMSIEEGGENGEGGSSLEKVCSWHMAAPSENVLLMPKFVEAKGDEPDELGETEDAEMKAEETECGEEKVEEFEHIAPAAVATAVESKETAVECLEEIKTKPEEMKPEETKPEETKPEETKPEKMKPEETKPEETKPEEPKPEEPKPEEPKPEESKPEEPKPEEPKPEEPKPEPEQAKPGECKGIVPTIAIDSTCPSGICVPLPPCSLTGLKDQCKDQPCAEHPPVVYIIIKHPDACSGCSFGQAQQPPIEPVPAEPIHELADSTCICSISPCPKEGTAPPSAVSEPPPAAEETPAKEEPTLEPPCPGDATDEASIDECSPEVNASQGWVTSTGVESVEQSAEENAQGPPAEEVPDEETPVEEAPVEEAPVEEAPVEEAPVEGAPVAEAPIEEAPVEGAPVEEAPVTEKPAIPGEPVELACSDKSDESSIDECSPEANASPGSTGVEKVKRPAEEKTEEMPDKEAHVEEIPKPASAGDVSAKDSGPCDEDEGKSKIEEAPAEELTEEATIAGEIPNENVPAE